MDYDNDQEWQSYYDSMMIANSPGNLPYYPDRYASSPSSSPPPYGRFGERVDDEGGGGGGGGGGIADDRIFYEGDAIIGRDVSYEDEERDCEEEEEEEAAGGGADDVDHPTTTTSPSDDDDHRGGSTGAGMMMKKKKKKKRKGDGSRRKKRKSRRDPNKPKGCLTAVLLYSNANRARVKVENPDLNFGDIVSSLRPPPCRIYLSTSRCSLSKAFLSPRLRSSHIFRAMYTSFDAQFPSFDEKARLLSAEYSSLPPEGAATWQKASTDDRVRYNREMESYVPPPDDASDDDVSTTAVVVVAAKHDNGAVDADESRPASKRSKKGEERHNVVIGFLFLVSGRNSLFAIMPFPFYILYSPSPL